MISPSVSIDHVLDVLNDALLLDPEGMTALVETRVPVNEGIQEHPTIQVDPKGRLGFLGLLNGIFGVEDDGSGAIAAIFDEENRVLRFVAGAAIKTAE